ncbi:lysine--tRNA ligase [Entomospira culicis]|uniref:Lysine--tRNA ligase n=1 Tax=Entomospira culicis TaxID=2719989 RepID=A0A968GET9_9SPIO|nr:lysine--tRNA ligase [Entomospira culicis]NIZ18512.1 lysine--tRNA ligase [Entomospira culicis]NIZ68728.1 lysine--tRNA ligase [Entomospira culicis]WDI37982.1 lysine--tRNA ligase [Entomospira culicis]WDI39605.1 lysine--tRNA ligase [Entomospira culicis]
MTREERTLAGHWADIWADRIVRERGEKDQYTCASGITPSGTVHIGNFREIISTQLVYQALKDLGKDARFLYSWDDYDVFRKVPKNMPKQELLAQYLRKPIDAVPDVYGKEESYARANEVYVEELLPLVGINPTYLYQSKKYRAHHYAEQMRIALQAREAIRAQLNTHRTHDLEEAWFPISIFCEACERDQTTVEAYDGEYHITYTCQSCNHHATTDIRTSSSVKLPWRIDWPMRWAYEQVDFEPAGKDHHSEGGSFDTARLTSQETYNWPAPVTFMYEFVSIKGGTGKISSSGGEVIDLSDCLEIYQPEIVRYLFAGTRTNASFAISFDLDVIKIYEDYDRCERSYYQQKPASLEDKKFKKWAKEARIYELSQLDKPEATMPYQVPFRHLTTLLQIHAGDIEATLAHLHDLPVHQRDKVKTRAICAWNWIQNCAPAEFTFTLQTTKPADWQLNSVEQAILTRLIAILPALDIDNEETFGIKLYNIAKEMEIDSALMFTTIYRALLGQEKGPRLINFLFTLGKTRLQELLRLYQ